MREKRSDYAWPTKKDLFPGSILPVYLEFTTEEGFRGNAKLIERKPSTWRDESVGFIRRIIGEEKEGLSEDNPSRNAIMWKFQRWVVEFVDGPQKGHRTAVNIGYFHSYSFFDTPEEEE